MLNRKEVLGTVSYLGGIMACPEEFTWSWGQMIQYNTEYFLQPSQMIHQMRAKTSYHSAARNELAANFLGDWLFMTDTDHMFDPDVVLRMAMRMQQTGAEVLSALYRYKAHPYLPNVFAWDPQHNCYVMVSDLPMDSTMVRVDCTGGGCLMVRRRVFEAIRSEIKEEPFSVTPSLFGGEPFSEDFSFYHRIMRLGIPAFVDPTIYSTHLVTTGITNEMYDPSSVARIPYEQIQKGAPQ